MDIDVEPKDFMEQILKTTVQNIIKYLDGPIVPMTGPFARGDFDTIKCHIEALKPIPHLLNIYAMFGIATTRISNVNGLIKLETADKICDLLEKSVIKDNSFDFQPPNV